MDELDELDIELQDTDDVAARIVLLTAVGFWPEFTEHRVRHEWLTWLRNQRVLDIATDDERRLLTEREGPVSDALLSVSARAFDATWALGWVVQLHDESGLSLSTDAMRAFLDDLPGPPEPLDPFLDSVLMRAETDIAVAREHAEVLTWRLAAELGVREARGNDHSELRDAIAEVVLECATSLTFPDVDAVDFNVGEVYVRDLETDVLEALLLASEERLRALNWVCGLTDWESIHLPD